MRRKLLPVIAVVLSLFGLFSMPLIAHAQVPSDFNLQITPAPMIETIKPGVPTDIPLKVQNLGSNPETLKIQSRKFSVDNTTGQVMFDDTSAPDIAKWVTYSTQTFTIKSGDSYTINVHYALPKDVGFSYSFAIVISRTSDPSLNSTGNILRGSVADLALINVDKPGATRKLQIDKVSTDQSIYEFLPAKINVKFKNVGNTIVAPAGNVFIGRGDTDKTSLATLNINSAKGYILPGTDRTYTASWSDGFPLYKSTTNSDGSTSGGLAFNWDNLTHFRFGKYTAKVVAVYNDGQRDIPIESEVTFWVIPYRSIAAVIIILIIIGFVLSRYRKRRLGKAVKKAIAKRDKQPKKS